MKKYKRYKFTKKDCVAGGKKGGISSMLRLTPEQRKEKARKAIAKRWGKSYSQVAVVLPHGFGMMSE
jgi:hypothetical protein